MQRIWEEGKYPSIPSIAESRAISLARKFLEQYHSPVIFKSLKTDEKYLIISMEVGLSREEIINVFVDKETGKILSYTY